MSGGELSGRLRSRVAIERRDAARDTLGGANGGWSPVGNAWAELVPDGTGGAIAGDARSMATRWQVTLRAGPDVTIGDRLIWRGRRLRVRGRIDDPGLPDRITINAEEER